MQKSQFWDYELTLQVVVDLIPHCHWSATTVGGLIFHRRAMPDESEPEMSVHKNMVRSSNLPDHATLHVQLCFKQHTNLTNSSNRIMNEVRVGYSYGVSLVTKPLRSVF